MAQINLNEQARQILKIAEEYGVEQNFFFITTFKRYQGQIGILTERGARAGKSHTTLDILDKIKCLRFNPPGLES